jgi:hypothetical protein
VSALKVWTTVSTARSSRIYSHWALCDERDHQALNGRKFGGNIVKVTYFPVDKFDKREFS